MSRFAVVYDACVLYPAPLRDLLMRLAVTDLFKAHWTDRIHDEWINALLRKGIANGEKLQRVRELMGAYVADAKVTGFEYLIESLVLPDRDDRHVLAAAIRCNADAIVTFNRKDFPEAVLAPSNSHYGVAAWSDRPSACRSHQKQREHGMAAYERVAPAMGSVCGFVPAAPLIEECRRPLVGDTAAAVVGDDDSSGKACGLVRARVRSYGSVPAAPLIEGCRRPLVGDTAVAVVGDDDSSGKACGLDRAQVRSHGFVPAAPLIEECRPLVGDTAVAVVGDADSSGKACGLVRAQVRSHSFVPVQH